VSEDFKKAREIKNYQAKYKKYSAK